jgi:hypothetical protein
MSQPKKIMRKIIGRFYFKKTSSGNLIGEFSNNACNRNYTESAVLKSQIPDDAGPEKADEGEFAGDYSSTWFDEKSGSVLAELNISKRPNCKNIFSLKWSGKNISFWGEGMISDGILIGDYRDFEKI